MVIVLSVCSSVHALFSGGSVLTHWSFRYNILALAYASRSPQLMDPLFRQAGQNNNFGTKTKCGLLSAGLPVCLSLSLSLQPLCNSL